MLQNLTKGKMVEWVVLLVALVALGLSIAAVAKQCSSNFGDLGPDGEPGSVDVNGQCIFVTDSSPSCGPYGGIIRCAKNLTCDPKFGEGHGICRDLNPGEKESQCEGGGGGGSHGLVTGGKCQDIGDKTSCTNNENCVWWKGVCGPKDKRKCSLYSPCRDNAAGKCQIGTCQGDAVCTKIYDSDIYTCQPTSSGGGPHPTEDPCCHRDFICHYDSDCDHHQCGRCVNEREGMKGYCDGPYSKKPFDRKCNSGKDAKSGGKKALIGGGGGSPPLDNIGGGPGSTDNSNGSGNGIGGGGAPSPPSSQSPSPSPSPGPSPGGGGGKKSSDLPLILGLSGGGVVILLVLVYLVMTKRLKTINKK